MALTPPEIEALYGIHKITFYKNGLVVERKARYPMRHHQPSPRKGIYEMTRKSKMRLTHIVANCETKLCSLMTLTYGDYIRPIDGKELKRQINIFLGHLRKRFACEYVWFLEFTKREHPHIHIICTTIPNQFDRIWLGEVWSKISVYDAVKRILENRSDNNLIVRHPINMFDVLDECHKVFLVHKHPKCWEKVRKSDGAMRYALKYATKQEQKLVPVAFNNVGRFWGVSRGLEVKPIGELLIGETMSEEAAEAILKNLPGYQFELVPKYIFQQNALEFFQSRGLKLTEIFGKFYPFEVDEKQNIVL